MRSGPMSWIKRLISTYWFSDQVGASRSAILKGNWLNSDFTQRLYLDNVENLIKSSVYADDDAVVNEY